MQSACAWAVPVPAAKRRGIRWGSGCALRPRPGKTSSFSRSPQRSRSPRPLPLALGEWAPARGVVDEASRLSRGLGVDRVAADQANDTAVIISRITQHRITRVANGGQAEAAGRRPPGRPPRMGASGPERSGESRREVRAGTDTSGSLARVPACPLAARTARSSGARDPGRLDPPATSAQNPPKAGGRAGTATRRKGSLDR